MAAKYSTRGECETRHIHSKPLTEDIVTPSCPDLKSNFLQVTSTTNTTSTVRNSYMSPLFRLPAELRHQILQYAYGDIVVEIHEHYTPARGSHNVDIAKPFEYRFYASNPCWSSGFEAGLQRVHHTTPLITTSLNAPAIAECANCCTTHAADHLHAKLPLVSRQFWHDALAAFLSTLTLRFSCARVFYDWSRLEPRLAKQVRSLEIRMTRLSDWRTDYPHWALVLHDENLVPFEKLRSVRLLVQIGHVDAHRLRDDDDDVMNSPMWKVTKFPSTIRALQRHHPDPYRIAVALLMPKEPFTLENFALRCENPDRRLANAVYRAFLTRC